ncbi:MAG: carboxypeptidase-like regulatory domain-containing protein, partial [Candidatus Eremiobacteraeota bacterium]|nr:carboxypeptidase-like regulatory domain-containing protein [Candidatus Eremiobacteraeota bacterium]
MHALIVAACCLLSGNVHSASGPLADVRILVHRGATSVAATSDGKGNFSLSAVPGQYQLDASVRGYHTASILLTLGRDSTIDVGLEPLDAPTLRTIATVTVDGRLSPILGEIPSITLTRNDFGRMGYTQIVQGLQNLPGATFARPDGGSASAITVVALRGPDPSESLLALDRQLLNDG